LQLDLIQLDRWSVLTHGLYTVRLISSDCLPGMFTVTHSASDYGH